MTSREVVYRLTADIGQFRAQLAQASASVKTAADRMTGATAEGAKFRAGLTSVGDTAGKVGLVAAAGLGAAIKSSMDWESAWAGVTKTVDGSVPQLANLEEQLREMARTMPATHQEIAAVAEAAGQLGVATEDVATFTATMIQLAETTNLTADEAATSIAQLANVMGTTGDEIDNLGAALVAVGNAGASTEAQIIQMAQGIAGAANVVGLSEAEVLGIANAVASLGIEVEAGGTAISTVLTDMAKAVAQGGEDLDTFARAAGVSAEEFAQSFEERPAEAFTTFIEGLGRVNDAGGDVFTMLDDLGLSDVRVSRALLGMAADSEKFAGSLDLASAAWEDNSALVLEYAKRLDTTAAQSQIAWNNIKDAAIDVGDSMLPVVESVAKSVAGLAGAFQQLPGPIKGAVGPMGSLTAILGGGLWFTAKAVSGVADMRQAMADLGPSGTKAAAAMGKVGRAASAAAAGLAALAVIDSIQSDFDDAAIGVESMTSALLAMRAAEGLPEDLADLGDQLERLADPNWAQNLQTNVADFIGFGDSDELYEARDTVESLDAALASMVQTGNVETAAEMLAGLTESLSDRQAGYLLGLLPNYDEALLAIENDAKLAAGGTDEFGNAVTGAATATDDATAATDAFTQKLKALNDFLDGRASMREYEAALDDFTASIEANGKTFDITTEKGRENQAALDDIAASAMGVAEGMKDTNKVRFLTAAAEDIRKRAQELGLPAAATDKVIQKLLLAAAAAAGMTEAQKDLIKQYNLTPKQVETLIKQVEMGKSMADIKELLRQYGLTPAQIKTAVELLGVAAAEAALNNLARDRHATIWVKHAGAGGQSAPNDDPRLATGGPVYGPGTATSDSIPAYLSNGEYVIRAAAVEKYGRGMFDQLNTMRFASGGLVSMASQPIIAPASPTPVSATVMLADRDVQRIAAAVREGSLVGTAEGMANRGRAMTAAMRTGVR